MKHTAEREYTWVEGLAICLGMIGVQLSTQVIAQWGPFFYSPSQGTGRTVYVTVALAGAIFVIGTLWDAVTDPLIGMWSDRTSTKPGWTRILPIAGRRRPFMFWGSIFMVFTSIFFWYPPVERLSHWNFLYGAAMLCAHWFVFTITVVPFTALGPEIARSERARVSLGIWTAVGMVAGLAMAIVLPGILIVRLDPSRVEESCTLRFAPDIAPETAEKAVRMALGPEIPDGVALDFNALSVEAPAQYAGQISLRRENGGVAAEFRGGVLECLNEAHREAALRTAANAPEDASISRVPGGMALSWRETSARAAEAAEDRIQEILAAQLAASATRRAGEDGGETIVFQNDLLAKAERSQVEACVLETLPEAARGNAAIAAGENAVSIHFSSGADAAEAVDTAAIAGALAREEMRNQCGAQTARGGNAHLLCGSALLETLNDWGLRGELNALAGTACALSRTKEQISPAGFRRVAILFALLAFALMQIPVWLIRERYDSGARETSEVSLLRGYTDTLRNYPFVIYCIAFFLFTLGFIAVQNVLPYFAELGLGGDESTVSTLMLPYIIVCLAFFAVVPALTRRLHTKWMTFLSFFIVASGLPWMYMIPHVSASASGKMLLGAALFGYCGIAQSIQYVMITPMLGEIIDYDERRSGQRREALYNGLMGFANKFAIMCAILMATQFMHWFGNSVIRPRGVFLVGPVAALFAGFGMIAICFYPILNQETKTDTPAGQQGD